MHYFSLSIRFLIIAYYMAKLNAALCYTTRRKINKIFPQDWTHNRYNSFTMLATWYNNSDNYIFFSYWKRNESNTSGFHIFNDYTTILLKMFILTAVIGFPILYFLVISGNSKMFHRKKEATIHKFTSDGSRP